MLTALVGILLGNFLIGTLFVPALKRLRDTLEEFGQIQLPFQSVWALLSNRQPDEAALHRAEEVATSAFNLYFREYSVAFSAFKKLGYVFLSAVVVLVGVSLWQVALPAAIRFLVVAIAVGTIAGLAFFLQRAIAPSPSQLVSIDFMANNLANLHLEPLFDAADIHINFGRPLFSNDPVMHFSLFKKAIFLGYKLLFAITDSRCATLYFIAYGQVDSRTYFRHVWSPDATTFQIPLGDFPFIAPLQAAGHLYLHLWLFIPTPKGWFKQGPDRPRFLSEEVNDPALGGIRLHSGECRWEYLDANVDFERKSFAGFSNWRLTQIDVSNQQSPEKIVRMFKRKIEGRTRLTSETYPNGILISD